MWKDRFEKKILDRGYRYYLMRKVEFLEEKDEILKFIVIGTKEYEVVIDTYHRETTCNCPYALGGKNCKHMVASIYEYNSKGKMISKYDLEESKWIVENILKICDSNESEVKLMEFLDDIEECIYNDFNNLAENILIFSFVELASYVEKYNINSLMLIIDKIMRLLKMSLKYRKHNLQVKILNKLYNKIQNIYSKNPISLLFYIYLEKTFTNCRKEVIDILLENIDIEEDLFLEMLFEIYSKYNYDEKLSELANRYDNKEMGYKYIIEMEKRKENYGKVIEYCEKAIKTFEDNSYFIEYIIKITRNIDKYFDKYYNNVLLNFDNTRKILYEDYEIICQKISKDKLSVFKKNILEYHLKTEVYVRILYHEKMYEKILKQKLSDVFEFEYIYNYMIENYEDKLYSKICTEIIELVKKSKSMSDYENIANTMEYLNKFKDGYEKRSQLEKSLFEKYPKKAKLKKVLSYI